MLTEAVSQLYTLHFTASFFFHSVSVRLGISVIFLIRTLLYTSPRLMTESQKVTR